MARIENHKYSIEEAFRECFYIVPDYLSTVTASEALRGLSGQAA